MDGRHRLAALKGRPVQLDGVLDLDPITEMSLQLHLTARVCRRDPPEPRRLDLRSLPTAELFRELSQLPAPLSELRYCGIDLESCLRQCIRRSVKLIGMSNQISLRLLRRTKPADDLR